MRPDGTIEVYVAGKTHDFEKVKQVQSLVRRYGGGITHDWTPAVKLHGPEHDGAPLEPGAARDYAYNDVHGVQACDLMIAIPNSRLCGTLVEVGVALGAGIPVLWLGQPTQRSVFWAAPKMYRTQDLWPACDAALNEILRFLTTSPGYSSPNFRRDLWRMTSDDERPRLLFDVDVNGRPGITIMNLNVTQVDAPHVHVPATHPFHHQ